MRIRTQLIVVVFALAVLPLAAIVSYSYYSSREALERAYRREADRLTQQMDRRLAAIRSELDQRLTFVSSLPLPRTGQAGANVDDIVTVMGEAAPLIEQLEFQPLEITHRFDRSSETRVVVTDEAGADEPAEPADVAVTSEVAAVPPPGVVEGVEPAAPVPAAPPAPMVIDMPVMAAFPRYVVSEEQKELLDEIGQLGARMAEQGMSAEERDDIRAEIAAAQKDLARVVREDRESYQTELRAAQRVLHERQAEIVRAQRLRRTDAEATKQMVAAPEPPAPEIASASLAPAAAPKPLANVRQVTAKDVEAAVGHAKKAALILGRKFEAPVRKEGEVVGQLTARISSEQVVRRILGGAAEDRSEIPFAIDREGSLYTRSDEEQSRLTQLGIVQRVRAGKSLQGIAGWIVSTSIDPQSGLRIGVARPVGENFDELRKAAARNFFLGLGLIAFALVGIVPLSNHLTRDVKLVTDGAERIAQGDLMTRLPVKGDNEMGQLARAFNRMAEDLSVNQQRLVEQERANKEQELQQRLMAVEYDRKSIELEEARRFQLSMLPKEVPQHPSFDLAVFTRTATEVGGDYYDFHVAGDTLSVTIGDATGHGAKAGTMVTVVKTLFAGYEGTTSPAAFLENADRKIKRMDLGRMSMALSLARFEQGRMTIASAGMPPALVHRAATRAVEEVALGATPLGTIGTEYQESSTELAPGDTVLFLTDGFPELLDAEGQQIGYAATLDAFAAAAGQANASGVIASMVEAARAWHGDAPPNDDVTFVAVRVA